MLFQRLVLLKASLALKRKKRHTPTVPKHKFELNNATNSDCWIHFRFYKADLQQLRALLDIPEQCKLDNGSIESGDFCFCVFLKRMAYPNRLFDLVVFFGVDYTRISRICSFILNFIYSKWKWLLDFPRHLVTPSYIAAAKDKLGLQNVIVGFIDGTVRFIPRPTAYQKVMYNGHKRHHALKYQS